MSTKFVGKHFSVRDITKRKISKKSVALFVTVNLYADFSAINNGQLFDRQAYQDDTDLQAKFHKEILKMTTKRNSREIAC